MNNSERKQLGQLRDYTVVVKVVTYQRVEVSARSEEEAQEEAVEVVSGRDHLDFEFDYEIDEVFPEDDDE